MNSQSYGVDIQWIHTTNDIKNSAQLIADARQLEVTEILDGSGGDEGNSEFLDDNGDTDLDQIAAENLIFMARDGQMVNEIITAEDADTVVMAAGDGSTIELEQAAALVQPALIVDSGAFSDMYEEDAPQMVTEEVITDDWVQHQGEERVEIPADQIIGSNSSQVLLDMVQDEYTALRPYPCDFCSRRFRKKASLNNHMIAHQNDRTHLCKLCGARFSRRTDLINHFKAHAEQQVADEAVQVDAVVKFEPTRRPLDDHYYEQDWQFQTSTTSSQNSTMCPDLLMTDTPIESVSANSSSASSLTAVSSVASTTVTTRGRISRLKPKEEAQYIIVEEKVTQPEIEYMECQDLQAATAAVKLTQDQSPAHQQNFPVIDENKPFVCQECGLAFGREKALLSHVKNHRVDSPIECSQCNELFWDTNSLNEHQKTHQFEESNSEFEPPEADDTQSESESEQLYGDYYCNECGISFHRQDLLRRHLKQHSKKTTSADGTKSTAGQTVDAKSGRHCCNTCGETFEEPLDLLAHAEIHARFPSFKCVLCGEAFYEEQSIKRHLQSRHPHEMTPNSCILCGKECRDRKALIKHAWDHSREKCHSCSKCGKNFHNKARLKRHMASHRDKSVICDVCQEEFPDGRTLSNHRHSHSATSSGKLFPCNECGKSFGSRSSQQIHVRIHTGERPYGCRYCWKAFADGGTLRKHERIHTGEKPYACSVCPRAFNQRVVLREHIRSHHSGKDASRGTYFCSVCTAELNSSNELIQHLIQHSDMNTAKQRQPVTGPRKYKRRRKLQPHEIAHLQTKYKTENLGSDIDMSDFDMENVDDLLGITETRNKTTSAPNTRKTRKSENVAAKRTISNGKTAAGGQAIKAEESHIEEDVASISAEDNNNTTGKQRYDSLSSNSDKLWETKFLQNVTNNAEDSYKNLFNNDDQELPTIDSLVVNNNQPHNSPKTRRSKQNNSGAQRTQEVQAKPETAKTQTTTSRTRKKPVRSQSKTNTRPRMIHTEKSKTVPVLEGKRTRSKTYITRTETSNLDLLSSKSNSTTIVDDYEIISPATQPPNQISSSPLHIKQESEQHHNQQNQLHMYDAHLLLEASSLRKEAFEKFNPSIVNDLEEILRSPLKSDRNARQRFTSESSTTPQFLPEDERNLIKIEPTSPDLREIVEGQQRVSTSQPGTSARTTQVHQITANNKYLLDTEINVQATKRMRTSSGLKRLNGNIGQRQNTSASATRARKVDRAAISSSSSYLNYTVDAYNVSVPASNNSSDVGSTFFSISEVVSAADAAAAAASSAQAAATKPDRKVRQFECEMCSAVFYDRTQLLEHVHIHI